MTVLKYYLLTRFTFLYFGIFHIPFIYISTFQYIRISLLTKNFRFSTEIHSIRCRRDETIQQLILIFFYLQWKKRQFKLEETIVG